MKSVVILGTGRSGTSMVAACFRETGAFYGDELLDASRANPCGYYESHVVNRINANLIRRLLYPKGVYRFRKFIYPPTHYRTEAFWAVLPRSDRRLALSVDETERIESQTSQRPFCLKDPRFSATLKTWMPFFPADGRFIIVFRNPLRTVDSMMRDAMETYSPRLPFRRDDLFRTWIKTYRRLAKWASRDPRMLVLDSEAVLDGSARGLLEEFVGAKLNFDQVQPQVRRSRAGLEASSPIELKAMAVHRYLQGVASTTVERQGGLQPSQLRG